ncbi:STAS domain-containing protein [Fictibacillus sp. KIGAM418]|uniref:STAS domain-containing protein n=1 Tax=Fictibacillus marinisediminis TaxID=2878389 RepID=A0A9X1X9U9_9BACL|nr:STAS domain-containing protein [Fictibacillus marinisediminis]MCK6255413.1 STAS domain-containing protein [Fictibacillus marinisediminis]
MKNEIKLLGELLIKQRHKIAESVHADRMDGVAMTQAEKNEFQKIEPRIMEVRAEFITLFGEALTEHDNRNKAIEKTKQWGKETGDYFFKLGAPLDEALKDTSYYRDYIWKSIKEEATIQGMSAETIFNVIEIIDPLLDQAVYYFSLTYVQSHQNMLEQAKSAFLELSVPIVPLIKGTGVLPLIGNIDTERAHLLMEETLSQAVKLKLEHLIMDVSGVMIVDTMVADQLFKVIDALTLLGVTTILTGIRPEVAQTMVALGLNLDKIKVKGNLHQAFMDIQSL